MEYLNEIFGPQVVAYVVLPLLIFLARVFDVTVGVMRIIYVGRGMKKLSVLCGFFEVLIWVIAITQVMQNLSSWFMYIAYAGGFAVGNWVGITIEQRLAVGLVAVRVITRSDAEDLVQHLRDRDYGVTSVAARGVSGRVRLLFTIVKRKDMEEVIKIIQEFNPRAFISVEDIRAVSEGVFPRPHMKSRDFAGVRTVRKIK